MGRGRKRQFDREEVLRAALDVFWQKGFADTSVHDLELATGVNKSGLYKEFQDKRDLFVQSLRFYLDNRGGGDLLRREPLGFKNLKDYLEIGETCMGGRRGCFSVNSMREIGILPEEAREIIEKSQAQIQRLIIKNVRAARPESDAGALAELTLTFFSGLCIEQNLVIDAAVTKRKVKRFLKLLSTL